jgi:hypothetical protein
MSRQKRLRKLEAVAAEAARQRRPVSVRIQFAPSAGAVDSPPDDEASVIINLTRADPSPDWLASDLDQADPVVDAALAAGVEVDTDTVAARRRPRGQRPRQPTEAERAAAIEVLRKRAQVGQYLGPLPMSEAETAAESSRRETLRKDAALIKSTARPASFPVVRNAGNPLAAWAWTYR